MNEINRTELEARTTKEIGSLMKDERQKKEAIPEHDRQEVKEKRKCPVRYNVGTIRKTETLRGKVRLCSTKNF